MQAFPRHALQKSLKLMKIRANLALISCETACELLRVATLREFVTARLGKLNSTNTFTGYTLFSHTLHFDSLSIIRTL